MTRTAKILLLASIAGAGAAIPLALAAPGDTTRISLPNSGPATHTVPATGAAVSADGRYVAFTSSAQLTATATNAKEQLYVRDRQAQTTVLASSSAAGAAANDNVDSDGGLQQAQYSISGDGRYVVFASKATNLVPSDANTNGRDVFRKDLQTGAIVVVNVSSVGAQSTEVTGDPDISYDGSRVVFNTGESQTVFSGDANGITPDIALRDLAAGTTSLVSQNATAVTAERPSISGDGRWASFEAVGGGGDADVWVRNLNGVAITRASIAVDGSIPANPSGRFPDISGDGRYVVFEGGAQYDAVNSAPLTTNVYRRDMVDAKTVLVSASHGTVSGGGLGGKRPAISADGQRIAFTSDSVNLLDTEVPINEDLNADADIFVREPAALKTTRESTRTNGSYGDNASSLGVIAGNGGLVSWSYSDAGEAVPFFPSDTNTQSDVYARELIPSDATAPAINITAPVGAAAQRTEATQIAVTATVAADPSGIVETTIGGTPVTRAADGTISRTVPLTLGVNTIPVTARDGSGNLTPGSVTVERVSPAAVVTPPPTVKIKASRITNLKVIAGLRKITMRFQLSRRGTIRVELKKLPKLTAVRKPFARFKRIGKNGIVMPIPRLAPGRYRLILTTKSDGGTTRITRTFVVKR